MKWAIWIFFFGLAAFGEPAWHAGLPVSTVEPEAAPFWQRKEKVRNQVYNERAVVVAVQARDSKLSGFKRELYLQGAGLVNAPLEFTYTIAKRFSDYPKMSSYVKSANYDPKGGMLQMHTSAYGYEAHLKMQMEFRESDAKRKEIRFRVIEGVFKNLTGVLRLDQVDAKKCEISLTGQQGYIELPMPGFFVEFGLEFALQKMASRMRAYVEEQYGKKGAR